MDNTMDTAGAAPPPYLCNARYRMNLLFFSYLENRVCAVQDTD